jgi:hypothetical protein
MREKPLFYSGCALIVGGALAFAVYGYFHLEMLRVQRAASRLIDEQKTRHAASLHTRDVPPALVIVPPRVGEPVGRIEIPRLHISVIVLEGTAPRILRVAAGYIHGTALLGTTGNIGVAAHRDTFSGRCGTCASKTPYSSRRLTERFVMRLMQSKSLIQTMCKSSIARLVRS